MSETMTAQEPPMDAVEAVARALCRCQIGGNHDYNQKSLDYCVDSYWRDWLPEAKDALAAARPFIAAECAKVASDCELFDRNQQLLNSDPRVTIATAIKETIR